MTIVLALIVLLAGSAFLPRWWSHRVADQANGSFTSGIGLGLFYGFAFTLVALIVLWVGLRRIRSWKGRLLLLGVALLISSPNLLTLGIVLGPGRAAHAGERTLDVDAPGFRASSLIGFLIAVLVVLVIGMMLRSRRRSRNDADALRRELAETRRSPDDH
ncbi:MAG: permease [Thermoleophilia bacterium]|nr:permease [Thermoleophilia bacterium]